MRAFGIFCTILFISCLLMCRSTQNMGLVYLNPDSKTPEGLFAVEGSNAYHQMFGSQILPFIVEPPSAKASWDVFFSEYSAFYTAFWGGVVPDSGQFKGLAQADWFKKFQTDKTLRDLLRAPLPPSLTDDGKKQFLESYRAYRAFLNDMFNCGGSTRCDGLFSRVIPVGSPYSIIINKVYLGDDNGELAGTRNLFHGSIAVIVTLEHGGQGQKPVNYFVGYYEGMPKHVDLPFQNLVAYGTEKWDGAPVRVRISILDLSAGQDLKKYLGALNSLVKGALQTVPNPAVSALQSVGDFLLNEAPKQTTIAIYDFQILDIDRTKALVQSTSMGTQDSGSSEARLLLGVPALRGGTFALVSVPTKQEWQKLRKCIAFDQHLDLGIRPEPDCKEYESTLRDSPYLVVTVSDAVKGMNEEISGNFSQSVKEFIDSRSASSSDPSKLVTEVQSSLVSMQAEHLLKLFQRNPADLQRLTTLVTFYAAHRDAMPADLRLQTEQALSVACPNFGLTSSSSDPLSTLRQATRNGPLVFDVQKHHWITSASN